jgi:hypothetical protein
MNWNWLSTVGLCTILAVVVLVARSFFNVMLDLGRGDPK